MNAPTSRTGNGGSPCGRKYYNNVTLGKYSCLYIKLSTRIGNGGSPSRRATASCTLCIIIYARGDGYGYKRNFAEIKNKIGLFSG